MIDIHMHILPGIDDGAQDLYDSLDMAAMAVQNGITDIIATSHSCTDHWFPADYKNAFESLQKALRKEKIPLKIYPGMEILMEENVIPLLRQKKLLTLNGTAYILVEFFFDEDEDLVFTSIRNLKKEGLLPILAHAERFDFVKYRPENARRLKDMGCALQINKGSLLGAFGSSEKRMARELLKEGLADYIGTDAHNIYDRTPYMKNALPILKELLPGKQLKALLAENPGKIIFREKVF